MKFSCCQKIRQYAVVYVIASAKSLLHPYSLKSKASHSKRNYKKACFSSFVSFVCLFVSPQNI